MNAPLDRAALALASTHTAAEIATAIEVLLAIADTPAGDPDAEDDDPSGQCDEDDLNTRGDAAMYALRNTGPGCEISDPDADHDGREPEDYL